MNKLFKLFCGISAAVVLFAGVSLKADDTMADGKDGKSVRGKSLEERIRELEEKLKDVGYTGVKGSGIKMSGYVDTSYLVNLRGTGGTLASSPIAGANANANTGVVAIDQRNYSGARMFDVQHDSMNLNAVKLTLEKDKDDSDFPAGFRVDLMYGADANQLNERSFANGANARDQIQDDSDFFLEQAYVNLGLPVGDGIDVKVGKMVTLIGYEVIESPANANFSRSFAFLLQPKTQVGATMGYNLTEYVTATVGVVNGVDNDNGFINGGGNNNTEVSGVYRLDVKSPDWSFGKFNLGVSGLFGNDSTVDTANGDLSVHNNDTRINIIDVAGTWAKVFGVEPLSLGFEVFMESQENKTQAFATVGGVGSPIEDNSQDDLTAALYAKYQITDWFYLAGRGEYWDADARTAASEGIYNNTSSSAALAGAVPGTDSLTIWSGTITAGFNVWKDTLVRLEYRHDEAMGNNTGFVNAHSAINTVGAPSIRHGQDTIAVNVAYSF